MASDPAMLANVMPYAAALPGALGCTKPVYPAKADPLFIAWDV